MPNQTIERSYCDVSDDISRQRDAGAVVEATSAPPVGCRVDEAEAKNDDEPGDARANAEPVGCRADEAPEIVPPPPDPASVSENAPGGSSDPSSTEISNAADGIGSQRDFEAFLRKSGFSRAAAKALAAGGWPALVGEEPETADDGADEEFVALAGDLIRLLREP